MKNNKEYKIFLARINNAKNKERISKLKNSILSLATIGFFSGCESSMLLAECKIKQFELS